jgi:hypothetical protein
MHNYIHKNELMMSFELDKSIHNLLLLVYNDREVQRTHCP